MSTITFEDFGLRLKLKKIEETISPGILLKVVGSDVLAWIGDNFRREGIEKKWKPLAPSTIRSKKSSAILQDKGKLKQSFAFDVSGDSVTVGTANLVAPFHHHGTRPYTIRPVRAQALRFMGADGIVFARQVNHPGLASRALLPSKHLAARIAIKTIEAILARRLPK